MFGVSKSIIYFTLSAGTLIAAGTLIYGEYQETPPPQPLIDYLPPSEGRASLPPSSNIFTEAPIQETLPGVRRLKVAQPPLNNKDGKEVSEASARDFYLTDTRSASLIRSPVEARIETFPGTTLDDAVKGALQVDEWGFQAVQNYLNQALGDEDQLKLRMDAMLARIQEEAPRYDLATIADAANLIIEAGARAYWTAFMVPVVLDPNFKLKDSAIGWDLGPSGPVPYDKFVRVSPANKLVVGAAMEARDRRLPPSLLRQGIRNIETFAVNNLENGRYRIVVLTSEMGVEREPVYPFGVNLKRNGATINLVDTRASDEVLPVMLLATNGPGRLSDNPALVRANASDTPPATGHMLLTRGDITDGNLTINFQQLGRQDTYLTALLLYPEDDVRLEDELALRVAEFLQQVAPAAGGNLSPDQILASLPIVDPVIVFADGGNGLPTTFNTSVQPNGPLPDGTGGPGLGAPPGGGGGGTPPGGGGGTPPGGGGGTPPGGGGGTPPGGGGETPPGGGGGGTPPGGGGGTPPGGGGGTPPGGGGGTPPGGGGGTPPGGGGGGTPPPPTPPAANSLVADAGVYEPVELGNDFLLDGCGSTFNNALICSLVNNEGFELTFLLGDTIIGTGETLLVSTGEGTLFTQTGDFEVTLEVRYDGTLLDGDQLIALLGGGTLLLPGDVILTSLDTTIITIVAAIPEPAAALVLLPGLAFMARRHRKRKTAAARQPA